MAWYKLAWQLRVAAITLSFGTTALADFVEIEKAVAPLVRQAAEEINGRRVAVAARATGQPVFWHPQDAFATEMTLGLLAEGLDAIRAARHPRLASLNQSNSAFTKNDAERLSDTDRDLMLGIELMAGNKPRLTVVLFDDAGNRLWKRRVEISTDALEVEANVPKLSQSVVNFCRRNLNKKVGTGVCTQVPALALEHANANRPSIYTWGRELDDVETILPGDIAQMENLVLKGSASFLRRYEHHSAVVVDVVPQGLVLCHQNVGNKGQVAQQDYWPIDARVARGRLVFFRPWNGEHAMPPVSPRRRIAPVIRSSGNQVDLLKAIDPTLDGVQGIWFWDNGLAWNRDSFVSLQVPVAPPKKYRLRILVRRTFGSRGMGIGIVVDGNPTSILVDGFSSIPEKKISGISFLDGKNANGNATVHRGEIIPMEKDTELIVDVTPSSVKLQADGKTIFDWHGSASRLTLPPVDKVRFRDMPRKDWMYLCAWHTNYRVKEFVMEEQ